MKNFLLTSVCAVLISATLSAQDKTLDIAGLHFGQTHDCNGIRFNLVDDLHFRSETDAWKDNVGESINGISLGLISCNRQTNGISFGLLTTWDSLSNGVMFSIFQTAAHKFNGAGFSIFTSATVFNGLGIGGISFTADSVMNGVFIAPLIVGKKMNGLVISPLGFLPDEGQLNGVAIIGYMGRLESMNGFIFSPRTIIKTQHGLSIGAVNRTEKLKGVQIGLWNVALNKKHLKRLPFINFCFD